VSTTQAATKEAIAFEAINDLLYEAMLNCENALKSGIRIQEDSVKLWRDLLAKVDSYNLLKSKLDALSTELFPTLRKRLEEMVESSSLSLMLINRTGSQTLALLEKSLEFCESTSIPQAREKLDDFFESYVAAMRENTPIVLSTNHKLIHAWGNLANWNPLQLLCATAQCHATRVA